MVAKAGHAVSDHPLRLAASAGTGIRCHVLLVHPRRTDTAHHKLYLAEELAGVGIDHQPVEAKPGETSGEELGVDPAEAPEFVSDVVATLSAGYSEVPTLRKPNQSSV